MIRTALPFLVICLAATLLLGAPTAVHADETAAPLPIALEDIELLPVHEIEWAGLLHEHRALVTRLLFLGKRIERVHGHLQARENREDAGSRKLIAQIHRIREDLRPHLARLLELLRPLGIDEQVLAVLEETPRGALRIERQAVRVVRLVPGLEPWQQTLFDRLVPAVEGAMLTSSRLPDAHRTDLSALQKRFWRVVDATLDRNQRAALRRRLPTKMAKIPDLFAHLYTLPHLSASQASRLKGVLVRLDQESGPDKAVVARVHARLAADDLSGDERTRLEREKQAAEARNIGLWVEGWAEGLAVLDAEQRSELAALPPLLSVADRPGDLEVWVKAMDLEPHQGPAVLALFRRYGPVKGRMLQGLARVALMEKQHGPDSPQHDGVEVARAQVYGEALVEARKAAHELVRDVFTTEQILQWVLCGE